MNLDRLITETLRRQLLVENAINNSRQQARNMVIAKFGCTEEYANNVVEEIRGLVGLEDKMRKFIKGCTRMYLKGEFKDQRVLGDFKDALNKIKTDGHIGQFDSDLRRVDQPANAVNTAKDIIGFFKADIDRERAEQRQKLSGMTFEENSDYNIVKINSFEEAQEYYDYTGWCVTEDEIHYDSYTGNGINQFYFCLQNGFKKLKNNGNFDDKKDAYALSMLAILVNPEGELIHCTNRKNNDQSTLNPFEISNLLGCNFYETFKPNTTWRDALEDVEKQLANGVSPDDIFEDVRELNNGLFLVRLLERWNILKGGSLINKSWYDYVDDFSEGFARVEDETKGWNFIDSEGNELCDRWYDCVGDFHEGFAMVEDEPNGWNLINHEGKEICERWYDNVHYFFEGFTKVYDENKGYNFINSDGKEICDRWYDNVQYFPEGFPKVYVENKGYNFINRDGKEICDRWYDDVYDFREGFAVVRDDNDGYNFIDSDGKEICDRWYYFVANFHEGFARVKDKNKGWNFINRDGKEICDRWYDIAWNFQEGLAEVNCKGKWYQLRKDGVLCDYKTRKPLEDTPAQMAESLINRLVRDVLSENRKRYYL